MADLRVVDALLNQPFGVFLFLITLMTSIVSAMEIVSPEDRWKRIMVWSENQKSAFVLTFSAGFFGAWLYKIAIIKEISTTLP